MLLGLSAAGSWVSPNRGYRQHHVIPESKGAPTATGPQISTSSLLTRAHQKYHKIEAENRELRSRTDLAFTLCADEFSTALHARARITVQTPGGSIYLLDNRFRMKDPARQHNEQGTRPEGREIGSYEYGPFREP